MGLSDSDPRPYAATPSDAYDAIRSWYRSNLDKFARDSVHAGHVAECRSYVAALPPSRKATDEEIAELFHQVLMGTLEWAYHESDGRYKMAAYAEVGRDKRAARPE